MPALRRNSPSGPFARQTQVGTATATKFSLTRATVSSVHVEGARPPRPAVQHPAAGAPPLPAQRSRGLPSAAAFLRPSQTLGCHLTSIQRDSPAWGFSIPCSFPNSAADGRPSFGRGGAAGLTYSAEPAAITASSSAPFSHLVNVMTVL